MRFIKEKYAGNIFLIPLYLPEYQTWRDKEDLINYGKYKFRMDDNYAFGRVIDDVKGGGDLIEVFRYVGKIPNIPTVITASGRLFDPVHVMFVFSKKRYPFVFIDNKFNKYKASEYENISFLLQTEVWKGGETIEVTQEEIKKLEQKGIPKWIVYTGTQLENRIRAALKNINIQLHYDQIVEQRKEEFPVRKISKTAFEKKLIPFSWSIDKEISFNLDVGYFRHDLFIKHGLLGNGYDWEKLFLNFVRQTKPEFLKEINFNSEAGMFSITSLNKKLSKDVALEFRNFCDNEENFENALSKFN